MTTTAATKAAASTIARTAENPPRCTAIYFSTHKIVKRIALVFSNIYRFVCSSFAVVVCVFLLSPFFFFFFLVLLFSLFCILFNVPYSTSTRFFFHGCYSFVWPRREREITLTVCSLYFNG